MSKNSDGGFFVRTFPKLNIPALSKSSLLVAAVTSMAIVAAPLNAAEISSDTKLVTNNKECSAVGSIWWNELLSPQPKTLGKFYASIFGWKSKSVGLDPLLTANPEKDNYTIFMSGEEEIAGMMSETHIESLKSTGKGWLIYFQVENVSHSVREAEKAGGKILQRPFEVADGHQIAIIQDPEKNVFGIVTPAGIADCKTKSTTK